MNETIKHYQQLHQSIKLQTETQAERIDVLNETIEIMNRRILSKDEHRQHLNETISNQAHQLEEVIARSERRRLKLIEQKEHIEYQNKEINALKQLQNLKE